MHAYSIPMTPAPTTIMVEGTRLRSKMPSASMMALPSTGTSGEAAGTVPVAMTTRSAWMTMAGPSPSIVMVCGSTKEAWPSSTSTPLRANWLR